jgi:hypothetical protein
MFLINPKSQPVDLQQGKQIPTAHLAYSLAR